MKVKVYEVNMDLGNQKLVAECDHAKCFPGDPEEIAKAATFLNISGDYVTGGGASPLMLLVKD
jgi:hypothetical protein